MGTLFLTKEPRIYNGAKTASSIVGLRKLDSYVQKNEIISLPNAIHNQSTLKEISAGISLEGMMLKLKLQYFGHLM